MRRFVEWWWAAYPQRLEDTKLVIFAPPIIDSCTLLSCRFCLPRVHVVGQIFLGGAGEIETGKNVRRRVFSVRYLFRLEAKPGVACVVPASHVCVWCTHGAG